MTVLSLLLGSLLATATAFNYKPNCYGFPDQPFTASNRAGDSLPRLLGKEAPDFEGLQALGGGTKALSDLLAGGKPTVIQFAEYSWPKFQQQIATTNALASLFGSRARFAYVYITEVHPKAPDVMPYSGAVRTSPCSAVPQALNYSTRLDNAKLINTKLCSTGEGIAASIPVLIDDLWPHNTTAGNNPVWCQYGQGPNMAFVVASNRTVVAELQWFDGDQVTAALNAVLGTRKCIDKCSLTSNAALCSNQNCSSLVEKYPCDEYYAPGKPYAGWCDRTCGFGQCQLAG